ncbi:carbon-nitrogen hydrolase family protein [Clostridium beijerinckii]|uniref:N-carbamoyl-D-amino acid hydrolase n=1 Tax=Clostridium beijerinckii TaxID=1520 RepID=A0A1S8RPB2_CLOBE|nr:carbon-nitrogen hydrolase family protein [Clostridium beijerinckii]NRY63270.1 putative amidohydrolase [Clostridium beijerinckii]OOM54939.1 N-carbamoyl-D-amino acid hydrolase [Clostridium beijerinckii]
MKIALAQMEISENLDKNLEKTLNLIEIAAQNGAQLICFPELQLNPFFPQYEGLDASNYAISITDEKIKKIQEKSREFKIISIPNVYLKENGKCFDASLVINSDGTILGTSKMVHIAQCHQFYEQDYYHPSDTGFKVYDTPMGKIGIIVCFDRHLPESFRVCALEGADIIIIPTANVKSEPLEMFEWEVRIPSMQNSVFTAMCNRAGKEDDMDFAGQSIVVDPNGDIVIKADDREQLIYADIDINESAKSRNEKPYMSLRRPEVYSEICNS